MKDQVDALELGHPGDADRSTRAGASGPSASARLRRRAWRLLYVAPERFASPASSTPWHRGGASRASPWTRRTASASGGTTSVPTTRASARCARACDRADGRAHRDRDARGARRHRRAAPPDGPARLRRGLRPAEPLILRRGEGVADEELPVLDEALVRAGEAAIVYAATRKNVERCGARRLAGHGVAAYHGGLDAAARTRVQDDFMSGANPVIVATNAFGMGIDKSDIRLVVHYDLPGTSRPTTRRSAAGRDGAPADCVLLYNYADVFTQERLIESSHPSEAVIADVWNVLQGSEVFARGQEALAAAVGASEFEVSAALADPRAGGAHRAARRGRGRTESRCWRRRRIFTRVRRRRSSRRCGRRRGREGRSRCRSGDCRRARFRRRTCGGRSRRWSGRRRSRCGSRSPAAASGRCNGCRSMRWICRWSGCGARSGGRCCCFGGSQRLCLRAGVPPGLRAGLLRRGHASPRLQRVRRLLGAANPDRAAAAAGEREVGRHLQVEGAGGRGSDERSGRGGAAAIPPRPVATWTCRRSSSSPTRRCRRWRRRCR